MNLLKRWQIKRRIKKSTYPDFIINYYQTILKQENINKKRLEDCRFVVLDTETTGLDTSKNALLSIGAVVIQNNAILLKDILEITLNRDEILKAEAVKIHGLTLNDLNEGESIEQAIRQFLTFLKADIIVAHHTGFDLKMLNKTIQTFLNLPFKLENKAIDTAVLAKRIDTLENPYEQKYQYDLDSLAKKYNVALHDRHTAWGDAFITAKLFLILTRILKDKGLKTIEDL
jgi:DNA polymerase-3 subunit epsilon